MANIKFSVKHYMFQIIIQGNVDKNFVRRIKLLAAEFYGRVVISGSQIRVIFTSQRNYKRFQDCILGLELVDLDNSEE